MPQERICDCGRIITVADAAFQGRLRCPHCGRDVVFPGAVEPPSLDLPIASELPIGLIDDESPGEGSQGVPHLAADEAMAAGDTLAVEPVAHREATEERPEVSSAPVTAATERPAAWWSLLVRLPITPVQVAPAVADRLDSPAALGRACLFMLSGLPATIVVMGLWISRTPRTGFRVVFTAVVAATLYRLISFTGQALVGHQVAWRTTGAGDFSRGLGALALLNGMLGWLSVILIPTAASVRWTAVWLTRALALVVYAVVVRSGEPLLAAVYEAADQRFLAAPLACAVVDAVLVFVLAPIVLGMPF